MNQTAQLSLQKEQSHSRTFECENLKRYASLALIITAIVLLVISAIAASHGCMAVFGVLFSVGTILLFLGFTILLSSGKKLENELVKRCHGAAKELYERSGVWKKTLTDQMLDLFSKERFNIDELYANSDEEEDPKQTQLL